MFKRNIKFIIFGVCIGIVSFFSMGSLFIILLSVTIYYFIKRFAVQDRKFLTSIFVIGLCLRIFLSVFQDVAAFLFFPEAEMEEVVGVEPLNDSYYYMIKEKTRIFFRMPDSDYASARGYIYSAHAKGIDNIVTRYYLKGGIGSYAWSVYLYVIGLFYYLFGYSPIAVKFINCIIGASTAIFIYLIGLNFGKITARIACCLAMFFPSLILWSTTNLKDMPVVFFSVIMIWSFINLFKVFQGRYIVFIGISMVFEYLLLSGAGWMMFLPFLILTFIIYLFYKFKLKAFIAFIILLSCSFTTISFRKLPFQTWPGKVVHKLLVRHRSHVFTGLSRGGISYRILDDEYYLNCSELEVNIDFVFFVKTLTRGFLHFMLEPLPKRMRDPSFLVTYPQMLLWYSLIPFMFLGIAKGFKQNRATATIVLLNVVLVTMVLTLTSGNVGTLFRHRDIITPYYLLFAAIGLGVFFNSDKTRKELI